MRRTRLAIFLLALAMSAQIAALAGGPGTRAGAPDDGFDLYLVRHAEKTPDPDDPALTGAGALRAQRLAEGLAGQGIEAIWTSDYRRTRETAAPLAARLGLDPRLYDPRNLEELADRLRQAGRSALVVGHSNTTPQLAALLCACETAPMDESEYDRLLIVTIHGSSASLREAGQVEFTGPGIQR
ncbi:MAG: histidine phosphatase family protein [Xanthomonadales bacterium]|nr:histidine phosphatase family protein [Xanthomonadales bacterium]NIX13994.1 histidine phosphatase family protein [Xanthomonadales bacterium]